MRALPLAVTESKYLSGPASLPALYGRNADGAGSLAAERGIAYFPKLNSQLLI